MGRIRTTVTLDEELLKRVKQESRSGGKRFRETLSDILRTGLTASGRQPSRREFRLKPFHSGPPKVNLDCTGVLLEYAEGGEAQ